MSTDPFQFKDDLPLALNWQSLDHISRKLKSDYQQVVHEPVPDRFTELLAKLEQVETQSAAAPGQQSTGRLPSSSGVHRQ